MRHVYGWAFVIAALLKTHADWNIVRDPHTGITTWTTPTGRTHTRPPTVLDTHIDLDDIDPDTSHDLSLHALTGHAALRTEDGRELDDVQSWLLASRSRQRAVARR